MLLAFKVFFFFLRFSDFLKPRKDGKNTNMEYKNDHKSFFPLFPFVQQFIIKMVNILTVSTQPFEGQKPGTSGLRKRVKVFQQENYTENFIQAMLEAIPQADGGAKNATIVVGGDGRYYSDEVLQVIVKASLGQGVSERKIIIMKSALFIYLYRFLNSLLVVTVLYLLPLLQT